MTERDFCYWLHGFFELNEQGQKKADKLSFTSEQVDMIKKHLDSVFNKAVMSFKASLGTSVIESPQTFPTDPLQKQTSIIC